LHAVQPSLVLSNLYAAMDKNKTHTFLLVLDTTEARMETKIAKISNFQLAERPVRDKVTLTFAGF